MWMFALLLFFVTHTLYILVLFYWGKFTWELPSWTFLGYSHMTLDIFTVLCDHHYHLSPELLNMPKLKLSPLSLNSPSSSPSHWEPPFLPSVSTGLFQIPHISGLIAFVFSWLAYFTQHDMVQWTSGLLLPFGYGWVTLLWTQECKRLFKNLSTLLGTYSEAGLLGQIVIPCLIFWGSVMLFSGCTILQSRQLGPRVPVSPHPP